MSGDSSAQLEARARAEFFAFRREDYEERMNVAWLLGRYKVTAAVARRWLKGWVRKR